MSSIPGPGSKYLDAMEARWAIPEKYQEKEQSKIPWRLLDGKAPEEGRGHNGRNVLIIIKMRTTVRV